MLKQPLIMKKQCNVKRQLLKLMLDKLAAQ